MNTNEAKNSQFNSGVGVLDKFVYILEFLVERGTANLNEIVKETKISRSTAHRLLTAMEGHHLVMKNNDGYLLGSRLTGWGEVSYSKSLVELAKPKLTKLTEITGESSQLYVREGDKRICIASVEPKIGLTNTVPVGSVFPLEVGSAGKVFLVWDCDPKGDRMYDAIRQQGWVESVAEREDGVASVSAPIFSGNGILRAAVSVSGPISRMGNVPSEKFSVHVLNTAREIEKSLAN
ncbi:IclR family transcriptional regulator [Halalkalibacter urbisdiaboli]|uniref:IclR family transcriptional regulator n=1 Tax=Halalkalibacter urbisdiaboli TaxID=1960589 RepID=UPI000B438B78|nr:IclR family transcriptional regulator [Halalkalibacter urbisdiaboli]